MRFAISATYGPTDPTRAMLPFIFAAAALEAGDEVTLMLFADAVYTAVEGAAPRLVPVGPPNKFEEVANHPNITLLVCKPCLEARGLTAATLDKRAKLGGMGELLAAAKKPETQVVNF